jgi:predicted  nucleic acid-binding Zn-ribbon protein
MKNRHAVDELADVRREIKRLQAAEEELRDAILAGREELIGDEFEAEIREKMNRRIDTAKLEKELGSEFLKPYRVAKPFQMIVLKAREMAEEVG